MMVRPASKHPTELELAILKILWREGPQPVRAVRDELAADRDLAVTSVTTVMNIMVHKGYLSRRKEGRSHVYGPRVTEKDTQRRMLRDLMKRVFDGSASALMMNLVESGELDEEEIRELRKRIDRRQEERGR